MTSCSKETRAEPNLSQQEKAYARIQARGKKVRIAPVCNSRSLPPQESDWDVSYSDHLLGSDGSKCTYTLDAALWYTRLSDDELDEMRREGSSKFEPFVADACHKLHLDESRHIRRFQFQTWHPFNAWRYSTHDREQLEGRAKLVPVEVWVDYYVMKRRLEDTLTYVQRKCNDEGVVDLSRVLNVEGLRRSLAFVYQKILHNFGGKWDRATVPPAVEIQLDTLEDVSSELIEALSLLRSRRGLDYFWVQASEEWQFSFAVAHFYDSDLPDRCCSMCPEGRPYWYSDDEDDDSGFDSDF